MKFIVYGEPKAKGRPRFVNRGKFVSTYTPKETIEYENLVKFAFLESCNGNPKCFEGEVAVKITAFFSIPKSTSKKKKKMMIEGKIHHTKKPDIDNLCKSILDSLNKVAFKDDSQVYMLLGTKNYGDTPRVEVEIVEVEDE